PNGGILDWFRCHGARHRHMALTARPLDSVPYLSEWLFHHFGNYLRFFGVVPARLENGVPRYDTNKEDFLRWFGKADVLIDDSRETSPRRAGWAFETCSIRSPGTAIGARWKRPCGNWPK